MSRRNRNPDPGNPDPERIRRWHIVNPYHYERCAYCGQEIAHGTIINIEYEQGVCHAFCSD